VSTVSPTSRHDLTDAQWAVLVPLLPPPTGRGRARRPEAQASADLPRDACLRSSQRGDVLDDLELVPTRQMRERRRWQRRDSSPGRK
jgi:transposase